MNAELITPALLRAWRLPEPGGSKYDRGQVLVLGGARATPGAALLAGLAALRVGAGRLTLAVAGSVAPPLAVALPEAGVRDLPEGPSGDVTGAGEQVTADLARADAVLLGPGLAEPEGTKALLRAVVAELPGECHLVLDAFALGVLADLPEVAEAVHGRVVLTPNAGEAAHLLGRAVGDGDAPDAAVEIARRYGAVVTLQGTVTDGRRRWQATTGHAGLGTSGSGDVLAGALAGLLARGTEPAQAAAWATHLHAAAGDALTARVGAVGFLARELLEELPRVLRELTA